MTSLKLIRPLAVGGMAEILLASNEQDGNRLVIVKRLLPTATDEHKRLFQREREVLSCVKSENVVQLLGWGENYLVLEYVDGMSLASIMNYLSKRGKVLPLSQSLAIILGICRGLSHIHNAKDKDGIPLNPVHRDVNPSNIMVSKKGEVKVLDLGVVHIQDRPTTVGLKGTLAYMPKEQLLGRDVDRRSDIYSVGLIAYELLTGVAFLPEGQTNISELLEIRSRLPHPPSTYRPEVTCDSLVMMALAPDINERPMDAEKWANDLIQACGVKPNFEQLGKFVYQISSAEPKVHKTIVKVQKKASRWKYILAVFVLFLALVSIFLFLMLQPKDPIISEDIYEDRGLDKFEEQEKFYEAYMSDAIQKQVLDVNLEVPVLKKPKKVFSLQSTITSKKKTIRIHSLEGHLYCFSEGNKGFAPMEFDIEKPRLIKLTGGKKGFSILLRLETSGHETKMHIGAKEGEFHHVVCGKEDFGYTPVLGIGFEKRVQCTIENQDGDVIRFALEYLDM